MGLGSTECKVEEAGGMSEGVEKSLSAAGDGEEKDSAGVSWRVTRGGLGGGPSMPSEDDKDVSDMEAREDVVVRAKGNMDSSKRTSLEI